MPPGSPTESWLDHWAFSRDPFAPPLESQYIVVTRPLRLGLAQLRGAIESRVPTAIVRGASGIGKSTLCAVTRDAIGTGSRCLVLSPADRPGEEIEEALAKLASCEDGPGTAKWIQTIVLIDDAHALEPDAFAALTAPFQATPGQALPAPLSLVLFTDQRSLPAFDPWIEPRRDPTEIDLEPLSATETSQFIDRRIQDACGQERDLFGSDAARAVHEQSGGLPVRVNALCRDALEIGWQEGAAAIDATLVHRAGERRGWGAAPGDTELAPCPSEAEPTRDGGESPVPIEAGSTPETSRESGGISSLRTAVISDEFSAEPAAAPRGLGRMGLGGLVAASVLVSIFLLLGQETPYAVAASGGGEAPSGAVAAQSLPLLAAGDAGDASEAGDPSEAAPPSDPPAGVATSEGSDRQRAGEAPSLVAPVAAASPSGGLDASGAPAAAEPEPPPAVSPKQATSRASGPPSERRETREPAVRAEEADAPGSPAPLPLNDAPEILRAAFQRLYTIPQVQTRSIVRVKEDGERLLARLDLAWVHRNGEVVTVAGIQRVGAVPRYRVESRLDAEGREQIATRREEGALERFVADETASDPFAGTLFRFEDFRPQRAASFEVERLEKRFLEGEEVYAVSARPRAEADYARVELLISTLDKALFERRYYRAGESSPFRTVRHPQTDPRSVEGVLLPTRLIVVDHDREARAESRVETLALAGDADVQLVALSPGPEDAGSLPAVSTARASEDGAALEPALPPATRRVSPEYPSHALERGLEGWVEFAFAIDEDGLVVDPEVVAAEPGGQFERAALRAFRRWRFSPVLENGEPVERGGFRYRFSFVLDDETRP